MENDFVFEYIEYLKFVLIMHDNGTNGNDNGDWEESYSIMKIGYYEVLNNHSKNSYDGDDGELVLLISPHR